MILDTSTALGMGSSWYFGENRCEALDVARLVDAVSEERLEERCHRRQKERDSGEERDKHRAPGRHRSLRQEGRVDHDDAPPVISFVRRILRLEERGLDLVFVLARFGRSPR